MILYICGCPSMLSETPRESRWTTAWILWGITLAALAAIIVGGCTAAAPVGWEKPSSHPARAQWEQARAICFRDAMTTRTAKVCEEMFPLTIKEHK